MVSALKIGVRKRLGDLAWLARGGQRGRAWPVLIILMYHAVTRRPVRPDHEQLCLPAALFRKQMAWLRELRYPVVSLREGIRSLKDGTLTAPTVAITFDDGYLNTYTEAFPILGEYGYAATVFLVPRAIESGRYPAFMPQCGPPMGWEHAREMLRYGITFGSHGLTHRRLSPLSPRDLEWEVAQSKKVIEDELSTGVAEFSYPYGWFDAFTRRTDAAVQQAGFTAICTAIAGHNFSATDVLRLRRLRISWVDGSAREIRKQCAGCYNWYARYQRWVS